MGHVGCDAVGVKQVGPADGPGPCTSQQSCPVLQYTCPQQKLPGGGAPDEKHGGVPQVPEQNGLGPGQIAPQAPQL